MDNAVALVQAYLRVNGYFTVAEYPVLEALDGGNYQTATDLDILAFRFPRAGQLISQRGRGAGADRVETVSVDSALGAAPEHPDMIVGEVKEGAAVINAAAKNPAVLRAALVRFGCCAPDQATPIVDGLLHKGHALLPVGHRIRMVVFGSTAEGAGGPYHVVTLGRALSFVQDYLRAHWDVLRHADDKDPAFGFLMMIEKALRGAGRATDGSTAAR